MESSLDGPKIRLIKKQCNKIIIFQDRKKLFRINIGLYGPDYKKHHFDQSLEMLYKEMLIFFMTMYFCCITLNRLDI